MKIYFCSAALAKQINVTAESRSFGHKKATLSQALFLWPERFHKNTLSPQVFLKHKTKKEIEKLIIIDRIQNCDGIKKINGHINRSGTSFLIAETPFKLLLVQIGLLETTIKKHKQNQRPLPPLRRCGTTLGFR
jgi:hypothetical protein